MTDTDDKVTEEKTTEPPQTPPAPLAPSNTGPDFTGLIETLTALPETIVNAVREAVKPEKPVTPTPATPAPVEDKDSSPGTAEPKLHTWFKPISAWGKDK